LDLATAPDLEAVLDRMMVIPDHIVVVAAELTFMDSSGLRLLMRASELVHGRIEIRSASLPIRRTAQVSGMSNMFCMASIPQVAHGIISRRPGPRPTQTAAKGVGFRRCKSRTRGEHPRPGLVIA